MRITTWLTRFGIGVLAGVVGTLLMVLAMAAERMWLGISPPPEAGPDRFAPTLDIATFFSLFGRFGGYNGLKKFGVESGVAGLFLVGAAVGVAYAFVAEGRRARAASAWRGGVGRRGLWFAVGAIGALWVATLALLWPVLGANYRGLPPSAARVASALGLLAAYAAYGLGLIVAYRFVAARPAAPAVTEAAFPAAEAAAPPATVVGRRAVVAAAAGVALAAPSLAIGRRLYDGAVFPYDGLAYSGPGVQPIAPNDRFYTVTKNVIDPNVSAAVWRLEVTGLVEEPRRYRFADLTALAARDQESTLMCISNRIGSGLFSNAVWRGVPMRDLLAASRPRAGAVEVLLRGADGYSDTFAFDKAMDPTTLVVYAMNGDPLPQRHGYPARVVAPGLFGEKNVKWVTGIEVVDHDAKGFYEQQGWGPSFEIPTRSDFFAPKVDAASGGFRFREPFRLGQAATLRGRAFAGDRGVRAVEVSADDGETWRPARIDYPGTRLTWVFWSFDWLPTELGEFHFVSRATDGAGVVQPPDRRGIVPQGAAGYHRVLATVEA